MLETRWWTLVWFGCVWQAHACVFDCKYSRASPSTDRDVCRGDPVKFVHQPGATLFSNLPTNEGYEFVELLSKTPYQILELSGRDIEAIAVGGLSCYQFVPYAIDFEAYPYRLLVNTSVLRGINLDNNRLTEMPNITRSPQLANASYLSYASNSITVFPNTFFVTSSFRSTLVEINLDNNEITTIPSGTFAGVGFVTKNGLQVNSINDVHVRVSIQSNGILELPVGILSGNLNVEIVELNVNDNKISLMPVNLLNNTVVYLTAFALIVENNHITHFPALFGQEPGFYLEKLYISAAGNDITTLENELFNGSSFNQATIILDHNKITHLPSGVFNNTMSANSVTLSLNNNSITNLPTGLFTPIQQVTNVRVSLDDNLIYDVGAVFESWNTVSFVTLFLKNNFVNETTFATILKSYTNGTGPLHLNLHGNDILSVPEYCFAGVGSGIIAKNLYPTVNISLQSQRSPGLTTFPRTAFTAKFEINGGELPVKISLVSLDISDNPCIIVNEENYFDFDQGYGGQHMKSLSIQLNKTRQSILPLSSFSSFGDSNNGDSTLTLDLSSNSILFGVNDATNVYFSIYVKVNVILQDNDITAIPPDSFSYFNGALDLSYNNITLLESYTFGNSRMNSVNLSHNLLMELKHNAFDISVQLTTLDLSYNNLDSITTKFTDNTPVLQALLLEGNVVQSLPLLIGNNRIFTAADANGNVLVCESYSPQLLNCTCKDDLVYNEFCGYGRCTTSLTGCEGSMLPMDDCSEAPLSICVSHCATGYLRSSNAVGGNLIATCIPYTDCNTTFGNSTPGYEFRPATSSTDRVCSACSVCPGGFASIPCNATANAICTKNFSLSDGDISAIVLVLLLVFVGTLVGTSYVFMRNKGEKTEQELELSQMLLGEVNEENSRMRKAWEIREDDLTFERKLASGSFGEVWSATWGHIPVAVKTLHAHLAEFPSEMVEFEREAIFMQSIRHPNLLIFYGAGIKTDGMPFLVVELMAKGSMSDLIKKESLPWSTRRRFALEVAQGMAHLHSLDSLHRDLKSDNCLVDDKLHVKVGDFGKSRLIMAYYGQPQQHGAEQQQEQHQSNTSSMTTSTRLSGHEGDWSKSLTSDVGTLLWMAPELFDRDKKIYGKEVDVYSFGIVMWELLTMEVPWDNHFNDAPSLIVIRRELTQMLLSGKRPTLPEHSNDADYAPYIALMKRCWATQADTRPPLASVAALLVDIAE